QVVLTGLERPAGQRQGRPQGPGRDPAAGPHDLRDLCPFGALVVTQVRARTQLSRRESVVDRESADQLRRGSPKVRDEHATSFQTYAVGSRERPGAPVTVPC